MVRVARGYVRILQDIKTKNLKLIVKPSPLSCSMGIGLNEAVFLNIFSALMLLTLANCLSYHLRPADFRNSLPLCLCRGYRVKKPGVLWDFE